MPDDTRRSILVECTQCPFSRVVRPEDDVLPADVIIDHGRATGHQLVTKAIDE